MKMLTATNKDIDDRTDELRDLAVAHPDIWAEFHQRFEMGWIFHENALEGIVLNHAEITSALQGRPIAQDTYPAIRNFRLAMDLIRRRAAEGATITMELVREIHAVLGSHDPKYQVARYRKDIPLHRTYFHDIAQPHDIVTRLEKLLQWAAENDPEDEDAIRFAAHFHHQFMSIFPFAENTGKVGRLLMNLILVRHGYLPLVLHATDRQRYYDTLRLQKKDTDQFLNDAMAEQLNYAKGYIEKILEQRAKKSEARRHLTAV